MSNVLAIESASEILSVALSTTKGVFAKSERLAGKHSAVVLPWVEALMNEAQIQLSDLDEIIFGAGPGAFTGVRMACSIAQGLAFGLSIPVIAAPNLEFTAVGCQRMGHIGVLTDARMGQCYAAAFEITPSEIKEVAAACLLSPEDVKTWAQDLRLETVTGNAFDVYELGIEGIKREFDARDALAWAATYPERVTRVKASQARPVYIRNHVALSIKERELGMKL
ncbi:MAG TPA: tRNA (adenosine(37)-N6)-threonylcarbamoyltransferase complex dimerization subunit type 1 TsaB [Sutterella sp.]|nr:tRNA (adenosine(37)-N6)-threonylcarbamoyltransferase complex dimerization subunit type 1 TsaB [Sutterella sp.]